MVAPLVVLAVAQVIVKLIVVVVPVVLLRVQVGVKDVLTCVNQHVRILAGPPVLEVV